MKFTILFFTAGMVSAMGATRAEAQDYGSVIAEVRADHQDVTAQFDTTSNRYKLTSARTLLSGNVSGSGFFSPIAGPVSETRTEIIGNQIKGEFSIELVQSTPTPFLDVRIEVNDVNNGFPVASSTSYKLPVKPLNHSSWNDFDQGKTIELQVTNEAIENHVRGMSHLLETALLNAFPDGFAGTQTTGRVEYAQLAKDMTILINKQELIIKDMATDFKLSLTLSY